MKRAILLLLAASLIFASCAGGGKSTGSEELTFKTVTANVQVALLPDRQDDTICATIAISLEYPADYHQKEKLKKLQETFFIGVLGEAADGATTAQEAVDALLKDYAEFYRETMADAYEKYLETEAEDEENRPLASTFQYEYDISNEVKYFNDSLVSLVVHHYEYSGGAHGNSWQVNLSLKFDDNVSQSVYPRLSEEDIFSPGYEEGLAQIIREKLLEFVAENHGVTDVEEAKETFFSFSEIAPNGNFYLDPEGIHYVYTRYEIAAYSFGQFEVCIPYDEVNNMLKPDFFHTFMPQPE